MQVALEAIPITAFKTEPNQIVEKVAQQPLLLTQHGRSVAVIVSPQEWNKLAAQLAERKFSQAEVDALIEAYQQKDSEENTLTLAEHKARIAERIQLVEDIWDSIAATPENLPITTAQQQELDRRLEAHYQTPEASTPWAEAKKRIRNKK